jgi:hypothetical protein
MNYILVPPKILPFTFGEFPLSAGQPMTVTCAVVGGDRPMSVLWSVSDVTGMTIVPLGDAGAILTISSVQSHHAGNYTCRVSNAAGLASYSAELRVNGT